MTGLPKAKVEAASMVHEAKETAARLAGEVGKGKTPAGNGFAAFNLPLQDEDGKPTPAEELARIYTKKELADTPSPPEDNADTDAPNSLPS